MDSLLLSQKGKVPPAAYGSDAGQRVLGWAPMARRLRHRRRVVVLRSQEGRIRASLASLMARKQWMRGPRLQRSRRRQSRSLWTSRRWQRRSLVIRCGFGAGRAVPGLSVVSIPMRRCTSGSIGWPTIHDTRDIRKGAAEFGDLRFRVLDSAGLETKAPSDTIHSRTTAMTWNVLAGSQFAIFLIDVRFASRLLGILEEKMRLLA
ncbi:putative GTPase Der [Iris pallida]|uniref:GTPase Der n=1 Tax=Iris pallida TaxID=29817 RepID=A0AAX6FLS5_IRIPA|nr:putative GTPase Der [Iris pallida]